MGKKGFTLIELLIVVAIIGILVGIAIPTYIGQQRRAERSEAFSNLQNLRLLEEQFYAENGTYTAPAGQVAGADQPGNVAIIQGSLRNFRPGTATDLSFSYQIVLNVRINTPVANPPITVAQTPCFTAIATGNANKRVAGEIYVIDCNNIRSF